MVTTSARHAAKLTTATRITMAATRLLLLACGCITCPMADQIDRQLVLSVKGSLRANPRLFGRTMGWRNLGILQFTQNDQGEPPIGFALSPLNPRPNTTPSALLRRQRTLCRQPNKFFTYRARKRAYRSGQPGSEISSCIRRVPSDCSANRTGVAKLPTPRRL